MAESNAPSAPASNGVYFDHGGVSYFLRSITQDDRREVQALAFANALEVTKAATKYMDEKDAISELSEVRRLMSAGFFWWDGEGGWAYRYSFVGLVRVVHLCLSRVGRKNPLDDGSIDLLTVRAMGCDAEGNPTDAGYKFLYEKYQEANPTRPRPSEGRGTSDSTPNLPSIGEEVPKKLAG